MGLSLEKNSFSRIHKFYIIYSQKDFVFMISGKSPNSFSIPNLLKNRACRYFYFLPKSWVSLVKSNFANISNLYFYSLKSFVFYLEDHQKHLIFLTYSKLENVDFCKKQFCPKLSVNPFENFKLCKYIRSIFSYCKKPCFLSRIPLY